MCRFYCKLEWLFPVSNSIIPFIPSTLILTLVYRPSAWQQPTRIERAPSTGRRKSTNNYSAKQTEQENIKWLLITCCYTHTSVYRWTHTREAAPHSRSIQRPMTGQSAKRKDSGALGLKWNRCLSNTSPPGSGMITWKRRWEDCKIQCWMTPGKQLVYACPRDCGSMHRTCTSLRSPQTEI